MNLASFADFMAGENLGASLSYVTISTQPFMGNDRVIGFIVRETLSCFWGTNDSFLSCTCVIGLSRTTSELDKVIGMGKNPLSGDTFSRL